MDSNKHQRQVTISHLTAHHTIGSSSLTIHECRHVVVDEGGSVDEDVGQQVQHVGPPAVADGSEEGTKVALR